MRMNLECESMLNLGLGWEGAFRGQAYPHPEEQGPWTLGSLGTQSNGEPKKRKGEVQQWP